MFDKFSYSGIAIGVALMALLFADVTLASRKPAQQQDHVAIALHVK